MKHTHARRILTEKRNASETLYFMQLMLIITGK